MRGRLNRCNGHRSTLVLFLIVATALLPQRVAQAGGGDKGGGCQACSGQLNCGRCFRSRCQTCESSCNCDVTAGQYDTRPAAPSAELDSESVPLLTPEEMSDLTQPSAADGGGIPIGFGIAGAGLGAPNMIGDNFGNGSATSVIARVFRFPSALGDSGGGAIAFEVGPDTSPNDFFSIGMVTTSGGFDSVAITEPLPPTDAPTSPGPGFTFAGGTATTASPFSTPDFWDVVYAYDATVVIPAGGGGGGGGDFVVGRVKLAENGSPIPQDRIFVNYSLFDNVPLIPGGVTVNRFVPGFEKTFLDGAMSFELRAPLASTLSADYRVDGRNDLSDVEFGDLFMTYKALLTAGENWGVSVGLSLSVPTAADSTVSLADGTPLVKFENESVHLMPFVGGLVVGDRWFAQGFLQIDADANGDAMLLNADGSGLVPSGRLQASTLLYTDVGLGYWLYRDDPNNGRLIQGFAPTVELHYNRTLQDTDVIRSGRFQIGQPLDDIQILNFVAGATIVAGQSNISIGYSAPIGNGTDQVFDGELRVFWNRWL